MDPRAAARPGRVARRRAERGARTLHDGFRYPFADPAEITEAARRLVEYGRHDPESAPPLASAAP